MRSARTERASAGERRADVRPRAASGHGDEGQRILDHPAERDIGHGPRLIGDHLAHAPQDVGREVDLLAGRLQPLADTVQRRRAIRLQAPPAAVQIIGGSGERLVQLVRQGRGHRVHRLQPREVGDMGLKPVEQFARADILVGAVQPDHGARAASKPGITAL